MSLALSVVQRDYLSAPVSFFPTRGAVNEAVAPLFPDPRQQPAASSGVLCHSV